MGVWMDGCMGGWVDSRTVVDGWTGCMGQVMKLGALHG